MKNGTFLALSGVMMLSLMGCGVGGGGGGNDDLVVSRSLLTDGSTRVWKVSLVRANTNYTNGDSNTNTYVECPYSYSRRDGSSVPMACSAADTITFHENGQVEYQAGASPANGTWSLNGSTLSIQLGGSLGTITDQVEVRNTGRLILRHIQRKVSGVVQTTEAENAYVIVNP
jgi:hypothetical protein